MLIVVEGCVGAGKSTVSRGLAAFRNSTPLVEDLEMNPFLRSFYMNPVAYATETEFTCLLMHFHQLKTQAGKISSEEVIADFHIRKDLLYARLNLVDSRAKKSYELLYEQCAEQTPTQR